MPEKYKCIVLKHMIHETEKSYLNTLSKEQYKRNK